MTNSPLQKKSIIFVDFNGVLSYKNFWWSLENVAHPDHSIIKKINSFLFSENKDILKKWMVGGYSSEEINSILAEHCNFSYEKLWDIFVKDCAEIDISLPIIRELEKYKKTHWLILSTDNMDSFSRFTQPAHEELSVFDQIDNSYNQQMLKKDNNGRYFSLQAEKFGVSLQDCVFIDNTQSVCDIFSSIGGKSICVSGEEKVLEALQKIVVS